MARPVAAAAPLLLGPLSLVPLRLCGEYGAGRRLQLPGQPPASLPRRPLLPGGGSRRGEARPPPRIANGSGRQKEGWGGFPPPNPFLGCAGMPGAKRAGYTLPSPGCAELSPACAEPIPAGLVPEVAGGFGQEGLGALLGSGVHMPAQSPLLAAEHSPRL